MEKRLTVIEVRRINKEARLLAKEASYMVAEARLEMIPSQYKIDEEIKTMVDKESTSKEFYTILIEGVKKR